MKKTDYYPIDFKEDFFVFLDQTKLPFEEVYVKTDDYNKIAEAIERLEVRGAPQIGVSAAYALALAFKNNNSNSSNIFETAYNRLAKTRPTAVNLFWALNEVKKIFEEKKDSENIYKLLLDKAIEIHKDDIIKCDKIGQNGLRIFHKKSNVLTHCNTGKLATAGDGTAFNVIRQGYLNNLVSFVYADETRPLLQGSRLTAFELEKSGIPFSLQSDSTAAVLMQKKMVDLVVVGADRIALNGDTANKIGTYSLAVLCNFHEIPFYISAPTTTIDKTILTGEDIEIELRSKFELLKLNNINVSVDEYEAFTPAFDVTPSHLISGIITEKDVYTFPYNFLNE
ncbi:MAG TPA: S-methyl-5-thioribose-1-phosphate isomerase [Ignavibacteriaceae bacterium]|nr:S-methyl-5-thioribose-1-phosphate isomerase [Ignavibacteriaceae bacterium]